MADLEFSEVFGGDAVGNLTGKTVSDDELFADLGMIDPYTGTPIVTKADFLAWKERFLAEREHTPAEEEIPAESAVSAMMEAEWTKIREIDPAIGDLETLADQPYFPRIYEKVLRGYALADAFALVKAEEQRRFAAARAKQNMDRKSRGKEHLKPTAQRGGGEVTVSEAEMAEFQRLLPDVTKDDIRRFYKKDHKRKGRK